MEEEERLRLQRERATAAMREDVAMMRRHLARQKERWRVEEQQGSVVAGAAFVGLLALAAVTLGAMLFWHGWDAGQAAERKAAVEAGAARWAADPKTGALTFEYLTKGE